MQKYFSTTWRLWKLLKPFQKDFITQLIFIIISQGSAVFFIFFSSKLLDSVVSKNFELAFTFVGAFFVLKLVDHTLMFIQEKHEFKTIETKIQQYIQEYSFKKIFKLNPSQYQDDHSAIKLQVITRGELSITEIVSRIVLDILPIFTQITFSLIMIYFYSVTILLVCLFTIAVVLIWTYSFTNFHRPFIKQNMENWDKFSKIRTESFQHLYLIKIFSTSNRFIKNYINKRSDLMAYHLFTWLISIKHAFKRRLFFVLSQNTSTAILIYLAFMGEVTVGGIYAVWQYLNSVYNQFQTITRTMRLLPLRYTELEKYLEIIDKEPLFKEESKIKFQDGDIVFKNLNFKYPKSDSYILDNLNLTIPQGKTVAFVGHSGSGKTTITKLLLRAYDYDNSKIANEDGEILTPSISIGNVEIKNIDASDLRKSIGYVEQSVELFDDTVKNNILFGVDEQTVKEWVRDSLLENKLQEIAKLTRIDEFYTRLGEKKFETEIGERGIKLSGGEKQRIGIARAIIKDPSILIFDEATSALDTVNEKFIKEAIDNVSKGRTTVIIAHRLSTIVDCDIIFVMDKGKIVGFGNHDELIETNENYQNLIKHQELK